MDMEDTRDDAPSEHRPRSAKWRSLDFVEKFGSVSLDSKGEILRNKESTYNVKGDRLSCKMASQILWSTGMLSEPIPNGFYYVVPVRTKTNISRLLACYI
ncbi:unnamed protein product [Fraxinus pennsylvanica]|uniref:Uncharacterized protein n=1 Tax=Fraxinus pennsylvanica TaxID=56036 RepID=A0AAD2ABH7_9LAMI|nr:unnamed protein product [Fraxinus pennsylvanica]